MKNFVYATLFAVALAATGCGGGTKLTKAEKIAALKEEVEYEKALNDLEVQRLKNQAKLKEAEATIAATQKLAEGQQALAVFCREESLDKPGEYMAAIGYAQGEIDLHAAASAANKSALNNIAERFMGVIRNGLESYTKNTNTANRNQVKENQLEGAVSMAAEKAINKYAETACYQPVTEKEGTYGYYVALHIPLKEVVSAIEKELEVQKVDIDKDLFIKRMNANIERDQQRVIAEQERKRAMLGLD